MLVELGLTVFLSIKMVLVSYLTLSELIAIMLSTATSKKRVRLKALVISKALLWFLHLILVSHSPNLSHIFYSFLVIYMD
jgi:hypothetical protein